MNIVFIMVVRMDINVIKVVIIVVNLSIVILEVCVCICVVCGLWFVNYVEFELRVV